MPNAFFNVVQCHCFTCQTLFLPAFLKVACFIDKKASLSQLLYCLDEMFMAATMQIDHVHAHC